MLHCGFAHPGITLLANFAALVTDRHDKQATRQDCSSFFISSSIVLNGITMFDPAEHHLLTDQQSELVRKVADFTRVYFQDPKFDASHDFKHVLRVTALAIKILEKEQQLTIAAGKKPYDVLTVILGALLHDVDDKKYMSSRTDGVPKAQKKLISLGIEESDATKIQLLVDGVSYKSECANPQRVRDLLITIPELAIVQDADRLDAIGVVGIGRCFSFGAAKTSRSLDETLEHFDDKLFKLEGMMKTATGREMAARYTDRMQQFKSWWEEETEFAGFG